MIGDTQLEMWIMLWKDKLKAVGYWTVLLALVSAERSNNYR